MFIVNFLISAGRAFSEWRHREQAYAELRALDDHALADIGIHRSQIDALLQGVPMPEPELSSRPLRGRKAFAQPREA